ncbi:uncharacterized protein C2orf16 homolog [Sorex fumeus]|uniref:uncharacterized protein C2orf16 homolog n=1 Tax=Sorex fumeus TaxID=62283 RepID=UPI0024AD4E17|nr:uncharacterized protein C2orf16 homolog [Sorex fumeus]
MKFQDAKSGKFQSGPQFQDKTVEPTFQKMKSVDCKSGPELQDMSFSRLITGIKIHDVKSKKCTADPQVKVVKSSEVVPREKCQRVKSFEIIPSGTLQGVKSLELNPSPKLQDEKSSEFSHGKKFPGVESVGSYSGPQFEERKCSDLIMDIKLKNVKSTDLSSIPRFQGMKSSAVIPGTKTQAEKSMLNSGVQVQSKRFYPPMKLQSKNSTEVNHNPEFQAEKSTKFSLGPRIHSMISSEVSAEKQGQVKKSSQLNPWPELQGVKFMTISREPQLQHIKSSKLCKETIHQDKKFIKLNPEQQFQTGIYYELLLGPKYGKERFSELNPGPYTKNELYIQSKHSDEQFQEQKHETKCQGEKSSEVNSESQFQGINVLAYNIAPLPQGVKSKLSPRPYHQDIKSKMSFPGSHMQAKNSSTPIPEPKHQCVNTIECNTGPNKQCLNASETTPNMEMQGNKSPKLNPRTERNLCQSETSTVLGPGPHFPVWKSQLITESKPLSVIPRKCNLGPQMQCNSPELNPRPKSQGVNSMRWKQQVPLQDIKSFELTLGTKLQDTGCEVNPGIEIQSEKYILSDPGSHLQGLKCQLIPDSKPLGRVPTKCTPGPQRRCVNSPELLPGTKLQCTNSTGCRHGPPSQSIKCPELTSGIKLQDTGFKVNPGTETGSETPVVFHTEPHLQDLKSECISNSNCLPGATSGYNLEPQVQHADFSKLNAEPKVHCENYTGCKYGPPFQSMNFFQLASGTKYKDMTSSGLSPESECQGTESSLLNPLQNLLDIKSKLTPGTNFQVLMESNSRSQLQGMNSCNSNSESEYQSINSVNFNARPQMQDPKSYDLNPGPEFQGTTSILLNSGPHLQDVKISELTPCTNFPDLLLKNHLGSQQQVTQFVPTTDPQLNAVNFGAFLPESSLEDEMSVRMKKEALYCGANSVKLVSDPKKQDKKCEVSSLEPCFQKVESVELNPRPHSQGINSAELLSAFRQHSVRPVAPVLEGSSYVKAPELKARPQPKDFNSKNYCLMQKSTALGSEPCSQDAKSLESNLQSQLQRSLGLSSCLWSQCVKSDIFVPEPCFQDVKSVQLTPEAQQQGMNCQEFTAGQQGVKSMVLPQEPSEKLTPAPILASVKISNLSPESQQQDMTSLELTSHPKLQDIKHTKFPLGFLQQTPKSKALATGPQLQRVRFENLTPRMSDQTTDFSELSSRPVHQFVEYAEMSPKPQHQIPQSVNLIPSMYQVTESSEIAQRLAHQNSKTVKKSGGLTPKPIGKVTESSGMPPETDLHEPEFADLTSMLRDQCSQSLELTPEKSHQSSESPGLIPQLWPKVKKLEELHIKQLKQDVEPKEIIPQLKHCLTESIKFILKARSQREGFSGMMREPQSVSEATGHANQSPTPCSQAVEIIPEKRPYGQEHIALVTKSTSSVTESSEMTQDENVEFTPETGPQVERSIKLTGIPQQKVEYSRLGHQVPGSVYLTSKQCSQGEESLELPPKEAGQCERHGQYGKETSETWQQEERSKWLTQSEKGNMNYSEIAPEELGEIIKINRISPKPLDQINQPTKSQLQVARSTGVTPVATSKLKSVKGTPGPPVQVGKFVILPPGSFSQKADYIESISQPQDMKSSEFISGIWLQNKKPKKLIPEPTHQILETIEMTGFQIIKTVLFPGPSFQIVKSEKLAPGPIPQVAEPIGIALSLGPKERPCFDFLTMKHFQELAEPVELTPRSNTEVKSTEFATKTASPFMEPKGLTHEKKLQTLKPRSEKAGPSTVTESEDLIREQLCLNRESEELLSLGEVEEKYFPKFLCSSSNSLTSSTVKTSSELGCLWDTEMPEVLRSLETKNLDSIRGPLSTHPLAIQNQPLLNIVNIAKNTHCEDLGKDMGAEVRTLREQAEEPKNSSKSLSQRFPKGWRSPGRAFQKRPGARRSLPCSVLHRQQNVWESHSWRQRLPRKYLSNMLMLGNVLQTNVERKLYSQSQLTERADTHQSVENVFGIPPELMEFSQSLPEKGQSAISQPSVGKNYIQRNTLFHGTEKRMTLRMWTRQSMSSIIQQYSGARIRINKIRNISYISQEFIHHMTGSYNTEAQLPVPLNTSLAKDSVPVEESENSQSEFQHSHRPNYTSQDKTIFSEQSNLLQELQLKVAAKLLRSQVPPNVPPPLTSGLVLKYPICLKCGRCSGFNCGHKLQASFGPYLLIYPQIHLVRTPEGRGEIRLHLGFRLRTGKRPQVPKYQRRDRPGTPKSPVSSPLKKTNIYTQVSRSPTSTLDLESGSSQSPLQDHTRQRSDSSCDLVGKTDIGEFSHYDVTQVQRLPDTDSESNQDENWAIVRRSKSKYLKRMTKGDTTPSTKFYTKGRESRRELPTQLKRKKSRVSRTTTDLLERQPKKPSQPKLIQLLSQCIKQAFQKAYNIMTFAAEKSEDGRRSDDKSVGKGYQPKRKGEGLSRDKMSVVKPNPRGSITKQKCPSWDRTDQFVSSQQPKRAQSFQPKLTHLSKPRVPQRSPTRHTRRMRSHQSVVQNDSGTKGRKNYKNETSSYESKNSETGNTVQARGRVVRDSSMKGTSSIQPKVKYIQSKNPYHSFGRTQYSASEKSHLGPSQRSCSLSERSHGSNFEKSHPGRPPRNHLGPSQRSHPSPSERKCRSPSERRCRSSSERRFHSLSGRGHPHPSERKCHRPSDKIHHTPLEKTLLTPEKNHHSSSDRNHRDPSEKTHPTPSEKSHPSPSEKHQSRPSGRNQGSPSQRIHPRIHLRHDWPPERSQRTLERRAPSRSESEHSPPKEDLKHGSLGERPRHTVVEDTKSYPEMPPRGRPQDPPNKAHLEARS